MIKKLENLRRWQIFITAAVIVAMLFAAKGFAGYMAEKSGRDTGRLATTVLSVEDFATDGMKQVATGWQATDSDPKMVYEYNGAVTAVTLKMDYMVYPGDVILYYTTTPGADFSVQKRIFLTPDKASPGCYTGTMPLTDVAAIRIDPSSVAGNVLNFGAITINPPQTMADYFDITAYTILMYMVYTALFGGILRFVQEFFTKK